MSLHDNGHEEDEDEEEEDQLDDSASDREDEEHSDSDRDGDELELDSDGLPRSGQRTRRSSTRTPPRSPPPPPHAPFQTPAPLRSISASQFATPATATPGTRRGRPIRFRVGPDVGDNFMDDDEPPSVLRSSRRAKRPLPPDESPSRSRVRASRWEDAGAAMDVDDEGRDQVDEEEEDDGNAARSQSSDREEVDELPQASGSWNVRKRARFG
ncbi:hypothetical protein BCR44DRAFT_35861 [Catenaria anguillulae PL171]|uniref:Uncharacterized protein n=1 Tax=Catenaria anguillulae PL171 TaxID=765915 RepID=A0A1Y2HWE3_9FUNG|nr:hypothetical protein BCR44DRAFT_35861 [Catenaria anguillulae PL171]